MASGWVRTSSFQSDSASPPLKRTRSDGFDVFALAGVTPPRSTIEARGTASIGWKVFNDPIHGHMKMDPLLVAIIDTPQFQRLRDVKQLGASYWVFPGGCHNRFEHCLGTAHLCSLMLNTLCDLHAGDLDINISRNEQLCIKVAGLCHDLGHGPFSHVFDAKYIKQIDPSTNWHHEDASCDMFDYLLQENPNVVSMFKERGCGEEEFRLIKDMIRGKDPKRESIDEVCTYRTSDKVEKWFLYEFVNNKRSGIDCDKFDYFARDCHYVGTANNFDHMRFFQSIRIICVDNQLQICIRDKECFNVYEMFHVRWSLHHRIYQHKTTKAIEQMIVEALMKVDKRLGISSSIHDMSRYMYLSDSIVYDVLRMKPAAEDTDIVAAQKILHKLQKRDLFQFCGQVKLNEDHISKMTASNGVKIINAVCLESEIRQGHNLDQGDIFVDILRIAFGMNNSDPVDDVIFFNKDGKPLKLRRCQISELLPSKLKESYIRVYSRDSAKKKLVEDAFEAWCNNKHIELPNLLVGDMQYFTNVHKSSAEKTSISIERSSNLAQRPETRRSIVFDQ